MGKIIQKTIGFDGTEVLAVLYSRSTNSKTGDMPQIAFYPADKSKSLHQHNKTGSDKAVCGECDFKGFWEQIEKAGYYELVFRVFCYVNRMFENSGFQASKPGEDDENYRVYRTGKYGEGTLLPISFYDERHKKGMMNISYTQLWRFSKYQEYKKYFMASCKDEEELLLAESMGWRGYLVTKDKPDFSNAVQCPNNTNKEVQCKICKLCSGTEGKGKRSIWSKPVDGTEKAMPDPNKKRINYRVDDISHAVIFNTDKSKKELGKILSRKLAKHLAIFQTLPDHYANINRIRFYKTKR